MKFKSLYLIPIILLLAGCVDEPSQEQFKKDAAKRIAHCEFIGADIVNGNDDDIWVDFHMQCPISKKIEVFPRLYRRSSVGRWEMQR